MRERIENLRRELAAREASSILIQDPVNVGYLTGFTGSTAALLLTPERAVFITDPRYTVQAERECPGFEVVVAQGSGSYPEAIAEQVKGLELAQLGLEADFVTLSAHAQLAERLEGVELKPLADVIGALRRIKDMEEIARLQAACSLVDRAFDHLLSLLRPGTTERDVAIELEYYLKKQGAEKEAFETVVASGARSALPHGRASSKPLEPGDLITIDYGARVGGYHSDLTRTVVLGRADAKQREVYGVVLEAELAALEAIRAGADGKAVDSVARDLIAARGYGEYFGHSLGHNIGRSVHEHTTLSQRSGLKLEAGMVLTVEPGIYIDGWGGVRIEDDVLVTDDGCQVLTHAPKHLIELPV